MLPKLTVITVTHNKGHRLFRTIQSTLRQTMPDFEFFVINDESTDDTTQLLCNFNDERLHVIHQKNKGFVATLEAVLQGVQTPYIAIQGAGDYSHPERFEKQIQYLECHEEVAVLGCCREDRDVEGKLIKSSPRVFRVLNSQKEAIRKNILNHGEVIFRTLAYQRAGGYRPFFKYAQDRDLWMRMIKYGSIASLPDLLYTRIIDPHTDVSGSPERTFAQAKFSLYAAYLAQGDVDGRWNNEFIDTAKRYNEFIASLGRSEKRGIARRIGSQVRASRMPAAEETKRLASTAEIMSELVPGSWMAREIALRRFLLKLSPELFNAYFDLTSGWVRRRSGARSRRAASHL